MNRLILVGNGFDLAHGLKTSYRDFLRGYLNNCFDEFSKKRYYEDPLITIKEIDNSFDPYSRHISEFQSLLVDDFDRGIVILLEFNRRKAFGFTIENVDSFFEELLKCCHKQNWVDIENVYYNKLKVIASGANPLDTSRVKKLNDALKQIIKKLDEYLQILPKPRYLSFYRRILKERFSNHDFKMLTDDEVADLDHYPIPDETLILNFNYTPTLEQYIEQDRVSITYIHGQTNSSLNPMIFGFGDEVDEDYKKIEDLNINEYFAYVKSFWYLKTDNYDRLLSFIDSEKYQICIVGQSCGLSDRTLLSMLFQHKNCKSIKIYYHEGKVDNNYIDIANNISRHFTSKQAFRNKVVEYNKCEKMVQGY